MKVKIVTFVPKKNADQVRTALGEAGAGQIGEYSFCSFSSDGVGRFIPSAESNPHIGNKEEINMVSEERIEVVCDRENAKVICNALRAAHPYEEVAFDIFPLLEESEL